MQPAQGKQRQQSKQGKPGKQQKWYDRYPYSLFGFAYGFAICLIVFALSLANIALTILKHWSVWLIPFCALAATFALYSAVANSVALVRYLRALEAPADVKSPDAEPQRLPQEVTHNATHKATQEAT